MRRALIVSIFLAAELLGGTRIGNGHFFPLAAKDSVTVAHGSELAREAGVFPWLAVTPDNAPR